MIKIVQIKQTSLCQKKKKTKKETTSIPLTSCPMQNPKPIPLPETICPAKNPNRALISLQPNPIRNPNPYQLWLHPNPTSPKTQTLIQSKPSPINTQKRNLITPFETQLQINIPFPKTLILHHQSRKKKNHRSARGRSAETRREN